MPNPTEPHTYARRVLLCVSGMTPQIVTETLHALLTQSPPFVPTEIHLITTAEGEAKARERLEDDGRLAHLCAERGVAVPPLEIALIGAEGEAVLTDIRSDADNTVAADAILGAVRTLAQDERCAIHASLAGGRKTMSHFMGYALSLFGRAQDRLSHVLVAPDWAERAVDFHYPPAQPTELHGADGRVLGNSADVVVTLADIPLLRLGDNLPRLLRDGRASFSETVRLANLALAEPELVLDRGSRRISASGNVIVLTPLHFTLMYWLASRVMRGLPGFQASCVDDDVVDDYLRSARDALVTAGGFADSEAENQRFFDTARQLRQQPIEERNAYFFSHRSKLGKVLKEALGDTLARPYLPGLGRGQPVGLDLAPESIRFEPLPEPAGPT